MKFLIVLLLAAYCHARPSDFLARPALMELGAGSFIIGGTAATPGEFPWQLSQQRLGAQWSHSCGSSLLAATRSLTAAHCVEGASVTILRVIAGLHDRSVTTGTQTANIARYVMHPNYNDGVFTFNNDIGILHFSSSISEVPNLVGFARLPPNNSNQHVGEICVISGWGRTSSAQTLPNVLQKASIQVISETECNQRLAPVAGARAGPGQICLYTPNIGSCNGDSGGPLNCGSGNDRIVSGVTSWGIQSAGSCLQTYPSVYTRTSHHLNFIDGN